MSSCTCRWEDGQRLSWSFTGSCPQHRGHRWARTAGQREQGAEEQDGGWKWGLHTLSLSWGVCPPLVLLPPPWFTRIPPRWPVVPYVFRLWRSSARLPASRPGSRNQSSTSHVRAWCAPSGEDPECLLVSIQTTQICKGPKRRAGQTGVWGCMECGEQVPSQRSGNLLEHTVLHGGNQGALGMGLLPLGNWGGRRGFENHHGAPHLLRQS